jgi:AraC-like DNA-binding protein
LATTIHSGYLRLLLAYLRHAGVDAVSLYGREHIDMVAALEMKARRPLDEWEAMMASAQATLPEDDIALKMTEFLKPMDTGPIGFLTMSCRDLREVADALAEFYPILNNAYVAHVDMVGAQLTTTFRPLGERRSPFLEKMSMGALCWHNRWLARRPDLTFDARFAFPAPPGAHKGSFEKTFGGRLVFEADRSAVLRPPGSEHLQVSHGGHGVWGSVRSQLLAELAAVSGDPDGLVREVEGILKRRLSEGELRIEDVATEMKVSVRTLQARMAELGVTFRLLLDRVRHALALTYTADDSIPLIEVADMLGFASQSSFNRAFQRWTGTTPGEHRRLRLRSSSPVAGEATAESADGLHHDGSPTEGRDAVVH